MTNGKPANHEEVKQENGAQEQNGVSNQDQHTNSSGHNGNVGSSWNDGHGNGPQGSNYGDVGGEPEQHGIGIKEDG